MNLHWRKTPWRLMLAINAAVLVGVFLYKVGRPPFVPYIHLLVDYHFGFTKRALIGAIVALFAAKIPVFLVFALGGAIWLLTAWLFTVLFRRTFGFDRTHLPLFLFMAGSPFFLKNFMHTLGHFDIYGCAAALVLLLLPAGSIWFVVLAALTSIILVLIHHIHLLMYVPTIAAIVLVRYYFRQRPTPLNVSVGMLSAAGISVLFLVAQFYGTLTVPHETFLNYLRSRMADPQRNDLLQFSYIWYQPLAREISDTWQRMPSNLLGVPVYALLIWLHTPLWRYFRTLIGAIADDLHRKTILALLVGISLAYLVMFGMVFDYSRWISNWAVCIFLMLFAVRALPGTAAVIPPSPDDSKNAIFGWILTVIPRVGIVRPF